MRLFGAATILVGLLATSMHTAADASLYRWKDREGNMVMSDRPPPPGTEYETISTDSSVVRRVEGEESPAGVTAPTPAEPKKEEPTKTASAKPFNSLYEKNPEYCEAARKNLEVIDRAPRIRVDDGQGGLRYITDEERAAERQKNVEIIEAHCE